MMRRSGTDPTMLRRALLAVTDWDKKHAFRGCLVADRSCSGPIKRAHTIQASGILEAIAVDGHIYEIQNADEGHCCFERVGRRRATTFTGFCDYHDTSLFRSVDFGVQCGFDPTNISQVLLLSLRAAAREYWSKMNTAAWCRHLVKTVRTQGVVGVQDLLNIDADAASAIVLNSNDIVQPHLEGTLSAIPRMERFFKSLHTQHSQRKHHLLRTKAYEFPGTANVAAASLFSPEFDLEGHRFATLALYEDVADIALNVFALQGRTWAVFGYHKRFDAVLQPLFTQLDVCNENQRAVALSKMLVIHCEQTAFSPRYVESLSINGKHQVEEAFKRTINSAVPYAEIPLINFFTS